MFIHKIVFYIRCRQMEPFITILKMALSKMLFPIERHIDYEFFDDDREASNIVLETSLRIHKIGGMLLTRNEFIRVSKVALGFEEDLTTLPCRVQRTMKYFVEGSNEFRCDIICRNSLGFCRYKMAFMDLQFKEQLSLKKVKKEENFPWL